MYPPIVPPFVLFVLGKTPRDIPPRDGFGGLLNRCPKISQPKEHHFLWSYMCNLSLR